MIFFFSILIILFLINIRFTKLDKDYLKIENTTIINGIFVIVVFFSHFLSYNSNFNSFDKPVITIMNIVSQLMVATFLFYSGYGIYCKIRKDRKSYIDSFFKKRFLRVLFNFDLAVTIFYLMSICIKSNYSFSRYLLSLIGWEAVGNSNWYIFVIFIIYLSIILVFKLLEKRSDFTCLIVLTLLSFVYIYLLNIYKADYWCSTLLCFVGGMWYSYYKDKIDNIVLKNMLRYILAIIILFIVFAIMYKFRSNVYIYNVMSIIFVIIISIIFSCISSSNKVLTYFGKNVFWIYILQRIPMILLKDKLNMYVYFTICFITTIVLTYIMNIVSNYIWKKISRS